MKPIERLIHHWRYPYLSVLLISVLITFYLASSEDFKNWVYQIGNIGYLGALLAGLLFTSSFTLSISIVVIAILAENLNPITLALVGGVGSAAGDYLLLRFIRDNLSGEVKRLVGDKETKHILHFLRLRYISWSLPIVGALVIASPLPDEIGIGLLGISRISVWKFLLISYFSNAFGILAIASVARVL
jgi:hypothetical protein